MALSGNRDNASINVLNRALDSRKNVALYLCEAFFIGRGAKVLYRRKGLSKKFAGYNMYFCESKNGFFYFCSGIVKTRDGILHFYLRTNRYSVFTRDVMINNNYRVAGAN